MVVSDFVPAVFLKATGKQATFVTGSTKWLKIIAIANLYIGQWQDEPGVDWNSLYSPDTSIGTVTAAQTFTLPSTIRKISDQQGDVVRITHTDGVSFTDYDTIPGDMIKDFANGQPLFQDNYVAVLGSSIRFNRAFASTDPQFGGTITVPAYLYAGPRTQPNFLSADADVIPVDIPNWLVFATAAEYIRTDVTRQPQYGNIIAEANQIMEQMKSNNESQISKVFQPFNPLAAPVPGEAGGQEAFY